MRVPEAYERKARKGHREDRPVKDDEFVVKFLVSLAIILFSSGRAVGWW